MNGELAGALLVDPFATMNAIGLVSFALVGATKAIREEFDLFGVAVVGLAAFTTAGAIVATDVGVSGFVVAIATINAVGGGAFADILLDRSPFVLLEDFYASCAVVGGTTYWLVTLLVGSGSIAAAVCAAMTVGTRVAAVTYGWTVPTAQVLRTSP